MCRKWIFIIGMVLSVSVFAQTEKPVPYVMHIVKPGETLYSISKMYGVTVNEVVKSNPSITGNTISLNQIIRIPNAGNKKLITNSPTENKELIPKVANKQELIPKTGKYHIVEPKQTLYSISKMYNVTVQDLQKWNNLPDNNVKIGMQLIVSEPVLKLIPKMSAETTMVKKDIPKNETIAITKELPKQDALKQIPDTQLLSNPDLEKPDIQASNNESQQTLAKTFKLAASTLSSNGTGAPMETTLGAMENVYFAMHKTLPIGTIIKIKNLVNNKVVYAKVIGKLPETDENKHVIVRYSLGVKKDLQLQNGKCYVQVTYPN